MTIRPFEAGDAVEVSQVIEACFTQLDLGDHTPQGVHLQLFANRPEELIARSRTVSYFVAIEGDKILGICGHDRQRIHTLFVRPDRHRQGIGGTLLGFVLDDARNGGVAEIRTWSTHFAVEFYRGLGFQPCRSILLPQGRSDIGLDEMVKKL